MQATQPRPTQSHQPPTSRWQVWLVLIVFLLAGGFWLSQTPDGVQGKADAVGYAICHRIEDRSFATYGDRQLPMCARCSGIYAGVMTGLLTVAAFGRLRATKLPSLPVGLVLLSFVGVLGVDGLNSYFHLFPDFDDGLYQPNNTLRVTTGMFTGLTMIQGLLPIFNGSVWHPEAAQKTRAVRNFKELAIYCAAIIAVLGLILLNSPFINLVVGFASAFGVLLVLSMVMAVMFMTLIGTDRSYARWPQLWLPMLAGLTAAIIFVGGIDALRFMLTGTWEGFVFAQQ